MAPIVILAMGIVVLLVAGIVGGLAQVVAARKATEVVLWAAAEAGLREVQQWEVRAMAAFIFDRAPQTRWVRQFILDYEFETLCVRTWERLVAEYEAMKPRECAELFGETGPW